MVINTVRSCRVAFAFVLALSFVGSFANGQAITLTESDDPARIISNRISFAADGTLKAPDLGDKAIALPLKVSAQANYFARRLPSAGRDERAYRNLRSYDHTSVTITVGDRKTQTTLPKVMNKIVAEGRREGLLYYSPEYVMSRNHLDLLSVPGDPLAILPLLPKTSVELNQEWPVDTWAIAMLTGMEAIVDSKLVCQLTAVDEKTATIKFQGTAEGAIAGAKSKVVVSGTATFDRVNNLLSKIEFNQQENRAIGVASPGMEVGSKTLIERSLASVREDLTNELLNSIPLDPGAKSQLLHFQPTNWKLRFFHDRNWYLFQETPQVVVLRLMVDGGLVSQCNVATIPKVAPGEHTSGELFQADIQKSLGERLKQIVSAEEVSNKDGYYIYRVVAEGSANNLEMLWNYYLVTAPDGRQVSLVFAVEPTRAQLLENRDLSIVQSIQFLAE